MKSLKPHDACPECKIGTLKKGKGILFDELKCTVCQIIIIPKINGYATFKKVTGGYAVTRHGVSRRGRYRTKVKH